MFIVVRALVRHTDGTHEGRVISRHRTLTAAGKADDRVQARCMKDNGSNTRIPTIIAEWAGNAPGHGVHVQDVRPVQIDA